MARSFEEMRDDRRKAAANGDRAALAVVLEEVQAIPTIEAELETLLVRAELSKLDGDLAGNISYLDEYIGRCKEAGLLETHSRIYTTAGIAYWEYGDFTTALEYFYKRLEMAELEGNRGDVGASLHNIGMIFSDIGDNPTALEYYHRALPIHEEVGNRHFVANTNGNLASVYMKEGEAESSLEYTIRAMEIHKELGHMDQVITHQASIAQLYVMMGRSEEAESLILSVLDQIDQISSTRKQADTAITTSEVLVELGKIDLALSMLDAYQSSIQIYPGHQTNEARVRALVSWQQGDLENADRLLRKALEEYISRNEKFETSDTYKALRDLAKQRGDFEGYIEFNEKHLELEEEIRGAESKKKMAAQERERELRDERERRERERSLLYGALPESVANRMLNGEDVSGDHFESVSVIFLDIVDFTSLSDRIPPGHVVYLLEQVFSALDDVCERHGLTKVKTIGDSYMAAAGVPEPLDNNAYRAAVCAMDMLSTVLDLEVTMPPEKGDTSWVKDVGELSVRIGVHTGPVTAGVIGKQRLQYDAWGDTVNTASRMESTGEAGRIQITDAFHRQLISGPHSGCRFVERGTVDVKGKGLMHTYWMEEE